MFAGKVLPSERYVGRRLHCAILTLAESERTIFLSPRDNHFLMETPAPLGVVLVVTAFNFPHAVSLYDFLQL
jgi:acyl-CoA reductase-like NAD-dependent aldehyde dehydrogenase